MEVLTYSTLCKIIKSGINFSKEYLTSSLKEYAAEFIGPELFQELEKSNITPQMSEKEIEVELAKNEIIKDLLAQASKSNSMNNTTNQQNFIGNTYALGSAQNVTFGDYIEKK